jgi:hypothetical protein
MSETINRLNSRHEALKTERASWLSHWQEIAKYLLPRSGRFFGEQRNRGEKRHQAIIDNTGTKALRILSAGLMSGMTSPSRPWFRLGLMDKDLEAYHPVKIWLDECTGELQRIMNRSNFYRALHNVYDELGAYGTGVAVVADDYNTVVHLHTLTAGEYLIASNWRGEADTLYREFDISVGALVREFGYGACSSRVKSSFDTHHLDRWVTVRHAIEPRLERTPGKRDNRNMPWRSVYWETGETHQVLRESGYERFPCLAPRWMLTSGDIYGHSPAMDALGDVKQLQAEQLRKSQAIDFKANPPLQIPSSLKNRDIDTLPGGRSYYDPINAAPGIRTAFEVNLDLNHLLMDLQDVRERIYGAFYADVFTMITQLDRKTTATEIMERHEEKMMMLGPVVERLNNELLDPAVETVFLRAFKGGLLPPAPPEIEGHDINIEYVSILAQAQKMAGLSHINQFVGSVGQLAQVKPEVLDRLDGDEAIDVYADKLGIPPGLIVPIDKAILIRQQRAQQQQLAQQQAAIQQSGEVLSQLGNTSTQNTLAGEMLERLQ